MQHGPAGATRTPVTFLAPYGLSMSSSPGVCSFDAPLPPLTAIPAARRPLSSANSLDFRRRRCDGLLRAAGVRAGGIVEIDVGDQEKLPPCRREAGPEVVAPVG